MTEEELLKQKRQAAAMRKMIPLPDMRIEDAPMEGARDLRYLDRPRNIGQPGMTSRESHKMQKDDEALRFDRIMELEDLPSRTKKQTEELLALRKWRGITLDERIAGADQDQKYYKEKKRRNEIEKKLRPW